MSVFDKAAVNQVIMQLDGSGWLFPQFELSKSNNEPVLLGYGGFSSVYEMSDKARTGLRFALKVTGFERHTLRSADFWDTEKIQWVLGQESRHIARVLNARELLVDVDGQGKVTGVRDVSKKGWEEEPEKGFHLQLELMEKLDRIIAKDRFKKVSLLRENLGTEEEVLRFSLEIGQALNCAHCCGVLHRDIKLENVFWDDCNKVYKLGDFGAAKQTEDGSAETVIYTDGYGAPEIERSLCDYYNAAADIYSFGITLYLLLNNLRFPGSEGYYPKAEVQYNPEYVFPAPVNASEGMTKAIRKMCSFRAEDRYQCMADVLSDLVKNNELEGTDANEDLIDIATETYREENIMQEGTKPGERPKTRAERIEEQKLIDQLYLESSIKFGIVITLILALLFRGMQEDAAIADNWLLLALPGAVLFEAVFQRVKEFHLFFGALTAGLIGISAFQAGVTMPHIIMAIAVLLGCPVLTASGAIATGIWMGLSLSGKLPFLDFLWKYDLGWVLLAALFIAVYKYFDMRMMWEKTTDTRAYLGTYLYDKVFLVMILAGAVLLILQHFGVMTIPEPAHRMHLIRTGIVTFTALCIISWWDNYLYGKGEDGSEDVSGLDE